MSTQFKFKEYYFCFSGCVLIDATSFEDAEAQFTAMSGTELAANIMELEVERADSHGRIVKTIIRAQEAP